MLILKEAILTLKGSTVYSVSMGSHPIGTIDMPANLMRLYAIPTSDIVQEATLTEISTKF